MMRADTAMQWIRDGVDQAIRERREYTWHKPEVNLSRYPTLDVRVRTFRVDPFSYRPEMGFFDGSLEIYADLQQAGRAMNIAALIEKQLTLDPVTLEYERELIGLSFEVSAWSIDSEGTNLRYPKMITMPISVYIHRNEEA